MPSDNNDIAPACVHCKDMTLPALLNEVLPILEMMRPNFRKSHRSRYVTDCERRAVIAQEYFDVFGFQVKVESPTELLILNPAALFLK